MTKQLNYTFTSKDGIEKTLNFQLLEARQGIDVFTQLTPVFTALFSGAPITEVFAEIKKTGDIFQLLKTLLTGATIDVGNGTDFPLDPNKYFAGNYGEMCDIAIHLIKENFGSFMDASLVSKIAPNI
ncbi:TPA: hypothetical protein N3288_000224 [Klebsiella aerogenes]|nr:hypothetical protein [Klebsiella aerogenes]